MSRGGKREGSGRKKGGSNRRIKSLRSAMREVAIIMGQKVPGSFEGDGCEFMVAVYKHPDIDLQTRLDAASKAAKYERPALQSIEHSGNADKPVHQVTRIERVIIRPANTDG